MARSEKTTAAPSPVALPARDTMRKPRASSDIGMFHKTFNEQARLYKRRLSPELTKEEVFVDEGEVFVDEGRNSQLGILSEFAANVFGTVTLAALHNIQ